MSSARVLVVDDEPGMVRLVTLYLQQAGFAVSGAATGGAAIDAVERRSPDLVVLDLGLPDVGGLTVLQHIRRNGDTPVVMLTARDEPRDRLAGFEHGADDYVSKPFNPEELVARVKAVLRRTRRRNDERRRYVSGGLEVDTERRTVVLDGRPIELRPKEFDLLVELMRSPGRVFTREQLVERVWEYDYLGDGATLDVHIWRLRRKLGETGRQARFIHTVWGVGYRFQEDKDNVDKS